MPNYVQLISLFVPKFVEPITLVKVRTHNLQITKYMHNHQANSFFLGNSYLSMVLSYYSNLKNTRKTLKQLN